MKTSLGTRASGPPITRVGPRSLQPAPRVGAKDAIRGREPADAALGV